MRLRLCAFLGSSLLAAAAAGAQPFVFVTSPAAGQVGVLDTSRDALIATFPVDGIPSGAALALSGRRLFVARAQAEDGCAPGALHPLERARLVDQVLSGLDPDEERALHAYLAGFNHVEVARLSGWSESVARHRIYRSMERLRRRMERARQSPGRAGGGRSATPASTPASEP